MAEGASSSYCVRKYSLTFKNLQVASYFEQLSHHNNVFSLKHPIRETNKFVNAFAGLSQLESWTRQEWLLKTRKIWNSEIIKWTNRSSEYGLGNIRLLYPNLNTYLPKKAWADLVRSVINSSTANSLTNFEEKCISTVESVWEFLQSAPLQIWGLLGKST